MAKVGPVNPVCYAENTCKHGAFAAAVTNEPTIDMNDETVASCNPRVVTDAFAEPVSARVNGVDGGADPVNMSTNITENNLLYHKCSHDNNSLAEEKAIETVKETHCVDKATPEKKVKI